MLSAALPALSHKARMFADWKPLSKDLGVFLGVLWDSAEGLCYINNTDGMELLRDDGANGHVGVFSLWRKFVYLDCNCSGGLLCQHKWCTAASATVWPA